MNIKVGDRVVLKTLQRVQKEWEDKIVENTQYRISIKMNPHGRDRFSIVKNMYKVFGEPIVVESISHTNDGFIRYQYDGYWYDSSFIQTKKINK